MYIYIYIYIFNSFIRKNELIHKILLIHKKEWTNAICSNMGGPELSY